MSRLATRPDDGAASDIAAEIRAFEAGDIDPEQFDHAAHVRVVWCYLQLFPVADTLVRFTSAIRALTERLGMPQKYHETITWFFIIVIANRVAGSASRNWEDFKRENGDLIANSSTLLKRHYSAGRLASPDARRGFVLPDLAPGEPWPEWHPNSTTNTTARH
jgi:hypothetical protein